jgi:uncharacterized membrane protein YjdF
MPSPTRLPLPRSILLVNAGYLALAATGAVVTGNREFIFYIVILLVVAACLMALHRRHPLTPGLFWCLTAWGGVHMAGGLVKVPTTWPLEGGPVLYNLWLIPHLFKFDQAVHVYGFAITAWLTWHLLRLTTRTPEGFLLPPTFGIMTLCAASGMGFGALNEVVEFIATLTMENNNVGGYVNTGWDLVSNLAGGLLAAMIIRWRHRHELRTPRRP